MSKDSLNQIASLLEPIADQDWHGKWRIHKAIAIAQQLQTEQPQNVVERVAEAIHDTAEIDRMNDCLDNADACARAAIAAMGVPERKQVSESVGETPATLANSSSTLIDSAFKQFWDMWYGKYRGNMPIDAVAVLIKDCKRANHCEIPSGTLLGKPLFDPIPDLRPIEFAYLALLKLSPTDSFRANNQNIYATLRDAIAHEKGEDRQSIQDDFEEFARQDQQRGTSSPTTTTFKCDHAGYDLMQQREIPGDLRLQQMRKIAAAIHYPACWDTAAYPSLYEAIFELAGCVGCSECAPGGKRPDADQSPKQEAKAANGSLPMVDCRKEFEYECPVFDFSMHPEGYGYLSTITEQAYRCFKAGRSTKRESRGEWLSNRLTKYREIILHALQLSGGWREAIVELEDHCSEPVRLKNMLAAADGLDEWRKEAYAVFNSIEGGQS